MRSRTCSICGDSYAPEGRWFLVAENCWEDKLKILEWNERLARHEDIHQVCSVGHVQELVVHWMTTGSLDYPFAKLQMTGEHCNWARGHMIPGLEFPARPLGELAVHRESMQRVLSESPHSLKTILDALLAALRRGTEIRKEPELETAGLPVGAWEV